MGARGRGQPVLLGGDQQAAEQEQHRHPSQHRPRPLPPSQNQHAAPPDPTIPPVPLTAMTNDVSLALVPGPQRVLWSGSGERLSPWPVSCTGSVVCAPTARSWLSRSGSAWSSSSGWWSGRRGRDEQRPEPARDREPAGDRPAGQPLPTTAERQQPDRLPRHQGQDHRRGQQAGGRVLVQGAGPGAARRLGAGPVRQRRIGTGEQGRDDRLHAGPAGHPQRRRHRGDRQPHPRHHRARAQGRRRRERRRPRAARSSACSPPC